MKDHGENPFSMIPIATNCLKKGYDVFSDAYRTNIFWNPN